MSTSFSRSSQAQILIKNEVDKKKINSYLVHLQADTSRISHMEFYAWNAPCSSSNPTLLHKM